MSNPYPVGTVVFAKLKGYPWWPARIEDEEDLPINVSSKKPKQRPIWPVFFFGSYDYGWFGTSELKTFDPASADKAKSTLRKGNGLRTALAEALDPSLIANVPEDHEDEDDSEEPAPKKKTSKAKTKKVETTKGTRDHSESGSPVEKKRRSSASEDPKRKALKRVPDDDDEEEPPKTKKRLVSRGRSETKKDEDIAHDASNGTKRSDEDADSGDHARAKKKIRSGQPNERLLKLRHKLQKLLLVEGLSDDVLVQNLERADPILAEVEAFEIDLQMLKDTKIGRLMKKISCLQFSQDQHHIVDRSLKLIKSYKSLMEAHNGEHSSHGTTSEPNNTTILTSLTSTEEKGGNVQDAPTDISPSLNTSPESLLNSKEAPIAPSGPAPEAVVAAVAAIVGADTFPPIEPSKQPEDSNVPV